MSESATPLSPLAAPVIDADRVQRERSQQSRRYATVASGIWIGMSAFLWLRGYRSGAVVCTVQLVVMLVLMASHRNKTELDAQRRFTHLFLAFSCTAVFLVAVLHPEIWIALFFLPLGIVMAAQVLGVRGALPWLGVNLLAFLTYPWAFIALGTAEPDARIDQLILTMGVAIGTYLSCHQSESLFGDRTASLVELSSSLHRLATHDALTGLMNRREFQDRLEASLNESAQQSNCLALLSIDMDGFKKINDTMGHLVGDDTLREVASRLSRIAGFDSVFRLGGDEFSVIVPVVNEPHEANELAHEIHQALCERYFIAGAEFQLGASIGVAVFPEHASSADELLAFADAALYHAKENAIGIGAYDEKLTTQLLATTNMQKRLIGAVERDEFFLVFQPQTEISSGAVLGVEALLRWRCDGAVISPATFVPLLEKSRLIIPVGRWLMREVCRQLREWTDAGYDTRISVNTSVVQFHDPGFATSVNDAIDEFDVDPSRLDFEVTEGVLIENVPEVVARLTELKGKGATISIDDFGTGYSSLAYLRQLPLDRLKIDRQFVKDIPSEDDGTIASSIITLAQTLGLQIVAEGVETQEQLDFLQDNLCDHYQGYLHSRPVEAAEVERYLRRSELLRAAGPSTTSQLIAAST